MHRVVILRFGGMGDILLTTPAARSIAQAHPEVRIDYIVDAHNVEAVTGIAYVGDVVPYDRRQSQWRSASAIRQRLGGPIDCFVNFQPSLRTRLIGLHMRPKRSIVYRKDLGAHAIDDFMRAVEPVGTRPDGVTMDFFVPEAAYVQVDEKIRHAGFPSDGPLVVVNPGSSHIVNRPSAEVLSESIELIQASVEGTRVVVIGGPDEQGLPALVEGGNGSIADWSGKLGIKELGALLSRADCVITGDTGPMHIAAAVGTPIVAIHGATDEARSGPKGVVAEIVRKPGLACAPCRSRTCARHDVACMVQMDPGQVVEATIAMLAKP